MPWASQRKCLRIGGAALIFSACTIVPFSARAGDAAAADVLFKQAKALAAEKRFAEACPKFETSYNLDKTVGTLMNLADCHENIGRIATAWSEWNTAYEILKREGDKRESYASGRRDALAPRLPYLRIDIKTTAENIEIFRGETRIEEGAYNTALPVDPGPQVLMVRRGGLVLKEERIVAVEGKTQAISFDLAALAAAAPKEPPSTKTQPASSTMRTTGIVLAGAGGLALAIAGGLELGALSKRSDAIDSHQCVGDFCSSKGYNLIESARTFAEAGQWVGIGGILIGGIGLSMILISPSSSETKTGSAGEKNTIARLSSARVEAAISPSLAGITIKGALW